MGTGIRGPSRAPCHAVRVEPADATTDGPFVRYRWPEVRARAGPVALHVPFEVEAGAPYLRNGWQSWSAPTRARYGGRRRHRPDPHDRIGRRHRFDRDWAGDESNDLLVGGGRVAGVVAHGALLVARPEHRDLLAIVEAPGPYPDVYVADADTPAVVGQLLARAGGRVPDDLPTGWCSWYGHYEHVTEPDIGHMLSDLRALPEPIDLIQVDDGWQAAIGDWHTTSDAFPSGRSAIARRVLDRNMRAGLWLAPFIVARESALARARPEWLLRDARGDPVVAMRVPHWGGAAYALDVTRPDVLSWLFDLVSSIVEEGFTYLKLDFLYAAALPGDRYTAASGHTAVRDALATVRAAAGDDTFLAACGAPLWPAIGLVDGMRVGPDVGPQWAPQHVPGLDPGSVSCLDNTWRAAKLRSLFHDRLWANDPDCVLLRRTRTRLHRSERVGWARFVAASGQLLVDGDRLADLGPAELELWGELVRTHREVRARRRASRVGV